MEKQNEVVTLVNISTKKWPPRMRTYLGALEIRTPGEGEMYAVTPIHACKNVLDLGDRRTMEIPMGAREIAEDLAREIKRRFGRGKLPRRVRSGGKRAVKVEQ